MRYYKSNYPIGATWEGKNKNGKIGNIWFAEISPHGFEIWRWSASWEDGSGLQFDWGTSYRACKNQIPIYGRFKRIK